ncbi:MAG: DUF4230 domain-containing protein [Saprospiraceae bacterium]|nr:DUF4230 domain-containing protein [Saprospiraceae bacterium]
MKRLLIIVLVIAAFAGGLWLADSSLMPWQERQTIEEATTLLNRIEHVTKLVTVDGYFSEVYDYKDYYGYDWTIFRKKALIRVKAKVSAGYDLGHIDLEAKPHDKTIILRRLPSPEILSIDHEVDYYDLREGTFNTFSNKDLTKLNTQAKEYIENAAEQSDLLLQAEKRGRELIETIRFMVESAGWSLTVERTATEPISNNVESVPDAG